MPKAYVLYNPLAGFGAHKEELIALNAVISDVIVFCDLTKENVYKERLTSLEEDDYIIVCGGDGTLNRFVNDIADIELKNRVLYYPIGSGNDFAKDLGKKSAEPPFEITCLIKKLPIAEIDGKKWRVINGVGFGIDGYCCEKGDEIKAKGKKVDYTAIAITGLLFKYKPTDATVTVDGKSYSYKKVWIAPTMHGRYYGGGMIPTPNQNRRAEDGKLSLMVFHGSGKLKTLSIFPSIFKGEHLSHTDCVSVHEGYNITVEFNRPSPLQVDGETVRNVTKYTIYSTRR